MLDINLIKSNPDMLHIALKNRNTEDITDKLLTLHNEYLAFVNELQNLREQRNRLTELFAAAKKSKDDTSNLSERLADIKQAILDITPKMDESKIAYEKLLVSIPNIPSDDCPIGGNESANKVLKKVGKIKNFDFKPKEHYELGGKLMDFEHAVKIAGSRFVFLFGDLARLERALAQFMLDCHRKNGYTEVYAPLLLSEQAMFGTGQLPKFEADLFKTTVNSYLIPTAEASLTNIYNNEILKEEDLPLRFTAYTPCFRSEAGASGRDTSGMIRQHQFGKVELVSITIPEQSKNEHERMTLCAEEILEKLDLPYQRVLLSTGDMGFSSEKTYDLEVWLPGQNKYREISSCSNCNSFQARRMNTRFKSKTTGKNEFVNTLNGSGVAVGRCLVAVIENYQQNDGTILVPDVLQSYMGGIQKIEPGV